LSPYFDLPRQASQQVSLSSPQPWPKFTHVLQIQTLPLSNTRWGSIVYKAVNQGSFPLSFLFVLRGGPTHRARSGGHPTSPPSGAVLRPSGTRVKLSSVIVRLSEVEDGSCSRPAARAKGVRGELGRPRAREGDRSVMGGPRASPSTSHVRREIRLFLNPRD